MTACCFCADAIEWALRWSEDCKKDKFHAILCDPPYHLTTITKRFGKENSAPPADGVFRRTSKGFMGKTWDGGDLAAQPDTWKALASVLHPGAFIMAYGGTRTYHRMAVAAEDAGLIVHPAIGWLYSSGMPKGTRLDNKIEDENLARDWGGHRYGLQALKPAFEFIGVWQKPYEGKPITCITETGSGALWIRGGLISGDQWALETETRVGRVPANFVLTHAPDCRLIGYADDSFVINRFVDGAKPFGGGAGHAYEAEIISCGKIPVWECVEECPCRQLEIVGEKHKRTINKIPGGVARFFFQSDWTSEITERIKQNDNFFYCPKPSPNEKNAGLVLKNPHPTKKPIALNRYLATLLLPPKRYEPRRLFNPFAGSGSEVIGAVLAGWEVVIGVEIDAQYVEVANQRIEFWTLQGENEAKAITKDTETEQIRLF